MAEPLRKWKGPPPTVTCNTRYESKGEVTVTMPVEMATYLLGRIGYITPSVVSERVDLTEQFFRPVQSALKSAGIEARDEFYEQGTQAR
jgi:hypothetical protein